MKPLLAAQRLGDVLDDPPVLPRIAGRVDRLVDLDHPALGAGDHAFVLLVQRAGQHDVGVPGGLVQEEVDRDVELQLLQHPPDEVVVGQRDQRVEADATAGP